MTWPLPNAKRLPLVPQAYLLGLEWILPGAWNQGAATTLKHCLGPQMFLICNFPLTATVPNFCKGTCEWIHRTQLCPSDPLADTFGFRPLARPPSTFNDASAEVTTSEDIFHSQTVGDPSGRAGRLWIASRSLRGREATLEVKGWMNVPNHTERSW